jgi:acylphosphatase
MTNHPYATRAPISDAFKASVSASSPRPPPAELHGYVRNLPDGRVEIAAEGDAEALERFERHVRHGPPGARVERVDVDDDVPDGRHNGFSIR